MDAAYVAHLRRSIGACLLGEQLGDPGGVNVTRVADILIERLPSTGWSFTRTDDARDPAPAPLTVDPEMMTDLIQAGTVVPPPLPESGSVS